MNGRLSDIALKNLPECRLKVRCARVMVRSACCAGLLVAAAALGSVTPGVGATPPASQPQSHQTPLPPKVKTVVRSNAEGILGQPMQDANGQAIGNIVDVLINADGQPQAAVVEFAGFLGVGNRDVAVDWKELRFIVQNGEIVIRVTLEPTALKAMPPYKPAANSVPVATSAAHVATSTP